MTQASAIGNYTQSYYGSTCYGQTCSDSSGTSETSSTQTSTGSSSSGGSSSPVYFNYNNEEITSLQTISSNISIHDTISILFQNNVYQIKLTKVNSTHASFNITPPSKEFVNEFNTIHSYDLNGDEILDVTILVQRTTPSGKFTFTITSISPTINSGERGFVREDSPPPTEIFNSPIRQKRELILWVLVRIHYFWANFYVF